MNNQASAENIYVFPCTYGQRRLWLLNEIIGPNPVYNERIQARIKSHGSEADVQNLRDAFRQVIKRHETLRTGFQKIDGEVKQLIHESVLFELEVIEAEEAKVEQWANAFVSQSFDLEKPPLFRVRLFKIADDDWLYVICLHHLICDGWSQVLLMEEISEIADALNSGRAPNLPELPIQYADYAEWEAKLLSGPALDEKLLYWERKLAGVADCIAFPTDFERPARQEYVGRNVSLSGSRELADQLKSLSRDNGVTLFMSLLTAFYIVVSRMAGESDVAIGSPVADRPDIDLESLIGMFINTLVFRANVKPELSFKELLQQVKQTVLEGYDHKDVPFELIVERLHPKRSLSHSPLFTVMFNMLNMPLPRTALGQTQCVHRAEELWSKYDLTLYASLNDILELRIVFAESLFTKQRMLEFLNQYLALLKQIVTQPDLLVGQYTLVTPALEKRIDRSKAEITSSHPHPLSLFLDVVATQPTLLAIEDRGALYTYEELAELSARTAAWISSLNVGSSQPIAVIGKKGAAQIVSMIAALRLGIPFLVLDGDWPKNLLATAVSSHDVILEIQLDRSDCRSYGDGKAAHLPTDKEHLKQSLRFYAADFVQTLTDNPIYAVAKASNEHYRPDIVEWQSVAAFFSWYKSEISPTSADRFSYLSSPSQGSMIRETLLALCAGSTVVVPPGNISDEYVSDWLIEKRISICNVTVGAIKNYTQRSAGIASSLRVACLLDDFLDTSILSSLCSKAPDCRLFSFDETTQVYAASEVTPESVKDVNKKRVGVGVHGVHISIENAAGSECGVGEIGEICVGSHLHTGDLGRRLTSGEIERVEKDERIVSNSGSRIDLSLIEFQISKVDGIEKVRAIRLRGSDVIGAIVETGKEYTSTDIADKCRASLPTYMIPKHFVFVDEIPTTDELQCALFEERKESIRLGDYSLRADISKIWASVLERDDIDPGVGFFDLGGTSLDAVYLAGELEKFLGKHVAVADLFEFSTIETFERFVCGQQNEQLSLGQSKKNQRSRVIEARRK